MKIKNYSRTTKRAKEYGIPIVRVPNLLETQIKSFEEFLQKDVHPSKREKKGLHGILSKIFPIEDQKGNYKLEYIDYTILKEKYSTTECKERNLSYQAPVKARMRLTIYDIENQQENGEKDVLNTIEQDVYLGEIPIITEQGTFIINGAERVIINQLHRSPGVYFSEEEHASGKILNSAKLIPYNGSWLEFKMDINDIIYVLIDKRRKLPVTVMLRALGLSTNEDLRKYFYEFEEISIEESEKRYLYEDIFDTETGEVVAEAGSQIDADLIQDLIKSNITKVKVIKEDYHITRNILENTIAKDQTTNQVEALQKIYNLIRPGEAPTYEIAQEFFNRMFFNEKRYDLGEVGRYKINKRLGLDIDENIHTLKKEDIFAIVTKLIQVYKDEDKIDDIDHLANRRIRTVGELLEEQYAIGLTRVARTAIERMAIADPKEVTIHDIINSNALIAVVQSFFLTGQLSQFMEQTNPLTAITHKRRLSALGPGGLTRERAGFEVRDVHYSHYGRICPIETPEGPNIGLITSPTMYSKINKMGFLETPYIKVENGVITKQVDFLDPNEEEDKIIAQSNINFDRDLRITDKLVFARHRGEFIQVEPHEVDYMDVSPQQIVSISAALIPFLEHDDANRALMGSNMQRQAVPLLNPEVPLVGTGVEKIVAEDSRVVVTAPFDGVITAVTASYIDIEREENGKHVLDIWTKNRIKLKKYLRSNKDTVINQKPIVKVGEHVKKGQILTDAAAIKDGRLALGRNLLVAFIPWYGYNFEDAIILSEKIARDDILTSIYIEEHEVLVRNMKNGKEELASDIPNVPTKSLRNLDKTGIIRVGATVQAGDIIVGKITPKNVDIDPSPEENLMRALFGDRAGDFTNTSLKAKPGMEGVVIDVKVFSRVEDELNEFMQTREAELAQLKSEKAERQKKIDNFLKNKLSEILVGQVAKNIQDSKTGLYFIPTGKKITKSDISKINFKKLQLDYNLVEDAEVNKKIYNEIVLPVKKAEEESNNIYKKSSERIKHGDELPYGIRKMVKVAIAKKRKIQVGDKMSGRHGNKGVISKIAPIEDMPFMEDGTPVDVILNPLGVPSRMNIGQIMETHLGMAAKILGFTVETPVFDGATEEDIAKAMEEAGLSPDGKQVLYDGKTGEPFKERVTVGIMYMLKLNHLVADKMHSRSTGPYSLITQQPLGGKAQHGGQRLGEMEVWALEAYGASRLLEEMLTIKSDDVEGRTEAFKAITAGKNPPKPGIPESFNVLVSELKSLCFNIEFLKDEEEA